ncbi:aldo/keto reductase family protein [Methyloterricola oryzae]|uniref:aldo/keto reductase family protein n=1 Tax=Methyloterricola oryzae TaxID=1495050 RepID=UPI0005EBED0B|nr:aldo/keto reductase [Methyloterricola oryzae]
MPRIIYGTAWKENRTAELVELAISMGFRGIDTACQPKHYDEPGVGEGLARCLKRGVSRDSLYLQTKFTPLAGQDPARVPYDPDASLAQQVAQSCEVSLRNLGAEYLDGLLMHSPLQQPEATLEAWRAMEDLFHSGTVRQLGLSNCYDLARFKGLWEAVKVKPAVLQNRFYADTGYDRALRAYCVENGVIYQSFWTLTANPKLLADSTVTGLAARYGRTPAQILFRCLTQIGIVPLSGTTRESHMREDLAIFEFELKGDELVAVTALL